MRRAFLHSLPFLCLLAGPALAADATPERAASAEAALRDFMNTMFGPTVRVGDTPIHLQPNGDHYDASATLSPGQQVTATVREGANGIWTFEGLHYPVPAHFTVDMPRPGPSQADSRVTYDLKAAEQDGSGTIDTTLATPSTTRQSLRALDVTTTDSEGSTTTSHLGRVSGTTTIQAGSAAGTVDMRSTSTASDYSLVGAVRLPTGDNFDLRADADTVDVKVDIAGTGREQGPRFLRSVVAAVSSSRAARAGGPGAPPVDKAVFREMFRSLSGLASSVVMDEAATKLRGVANGFSFALDRVRMVFDGRAQDGKLVLGMELETDGLALPALAGNPFASFIPTKFEIHPVVSGIDVHDLQVAMDAATDPARPDDAGPPPEFMALFASPALTGELASMEVDVGPSVITGTGKVNAPQPGRVVGAGRLTATQFDALTDRIKAVPEAAQALPVMLFAKGIARTEGDRLVWDISYDGQKALVNGVDIMALAGGAAPAPAPTPAPPPNNGPNNGRNPAGRNNGNRR